MLTVLTQTNLQQKIIRIFRAKPDINNSVYINNSK